MSFFDLDPTATQNAIDRAHLNPINPDDLKPGWFAGAWKAPVTGLASAVTDATLLAGDAAPTALRPVARPIDQLFGTKLEDKVNQIPDYALSASQFTTPDPRTTGVIGQVVHGLFNVIPEVLAGGPETAAVLQGYKSFRFGMADGLDPGTAFGKGAIDGISTWAGLKIPMTVAPRLGVFGTVGTGAAGNVVTGMASRGATGMLLQERGYKDMAEQYKVLDSSAIAVDLLMGGGMGALAHYGPVGLARYQEWRADKRFNALPTDLDTALNLNNQLHVELDTAPGIPTSPAARQAHVEAVTEALTSLIRGEDVNVRPEVTNSDYVENPTATAVRSEIRSAIEDHMGPEWVALDAELKARGLTSDDVDTSPVIRTQRETSEAATRLERAFERDPDLSKALQNRVRNTGLDYVIKEVPLESVKLLQHGEDYLNDSSRETARAIKAGEVQRLEDLLPIQLNQKGEVMDGHHRHAAAAMNGEKTILALEPTGPGTGRVTNLDAYKGAAGGADTIGTILAERADMTIPNDQGKPLPAGEVLAQADAEIASAKQDSQAFDAAVACALRG